MSENKLNRKNYYAFSTNLLSCLKKGLGDKYNLFIQEFKNGNKNCIVLYDFSDYNVGITFRYKDSELIKVKVDTFMKSVSRKSVFFYLRKPKEEELKLFSGF